MDIVRYTHYVEQKLNEKIDKLPVFESKYKKKKKKDDRVNYSNYLAEKRLFRLIINFRKST